MFKAVKNEKGFSLVLLALSLVVLMGMAAMAIDIGHLYQVKNQLQVAADAAALAGAENLDGTTDTTQTYARDAAQRIAALNFADVAYSDVPAYGPSPGAPVGGPIPVALQPDADIIVGNWAKGVFTPAVTGGTAPINAVEVYARRQGTIPAQPLVENWFSRVFSLFNTGISSVAIAARIHNVNVVPIAVNEYWNEGSSPTPGSPYNQVYPDSFMRSLNADNLTPGLGGKTFAIIGAAANVNKSSFNMNGYVDVLLRTDYHNGNGTWYEVQQNANTGTCSPSCPSNFSQIPSANSGTVNPTKYDLNFSYLFNGIPSNVIPPNAVREIIRYSPNYYPDDNYNTSNGNDPSQCPYATIPYFDSSGSNPLNKKFYLATDSLNGIRFWQQYPKGSKLIVMVYDGTHTPGNSVADAVTVVGYGIIQIDGYSDSPFNGDPSTLDPGGPNGKGGGTAYGHAVPLPPQLGADDEYILQPPQSDPAPDCSFTQKLQQLVNDVDAEGAVVLVDPNLKYGLVNH